MTKNSIRSGHSVASKASRVMLNSKSKALRKIAASALVNRKRNSK